MLTTDPFENPLSNQNQLIIMYMKMFFQITVIVLTVTGMVFLVTSLVAEYNNLDNITLNRTIGIILVLLGFIISLSCDQHDKCGPGLR
jgi:hypothetical protein